MISRSKSFSEIWPGSIDIRCSIVIKEAGLSEVFNATQKMKDTMNNEWLCSNYSGQLDEEQITWNSRYNQALKIFKFFYTNIGIRLKLEETDKRVLFFVAYFRGIPIGVLQLLITDGLPKVVFLATHCGIRGCGVLLIESAVNKSQQLGMEGKLQLSPYERAISAYMAMGFTRAGEHLELYPADRSDKWKWNKATGRYRFC
ncbi:GNAT family N-acetyltransferase [Xenorhabdus cabanillasii]|uniref:GNAT family N-acetyltransferase n=2 Tax=Xenorhabdus cabanillasii TaxID=351673 RepID=UPI000C054060|nr:GNAT family N-acetyltransferase [Xenorhabdus cabanillasii]PHM77338.1 N-acetyltransferase [Xenorhabdus cabanillasii JM26]